jgi:CRISPR/Cas system Type II protein with McrA/HNH and RuvC-like nuclease domain
VTEEKPVWHPTSGEHLPARGKSVHQIEQMARAEAKRLRKRRKRLTHLRHKPR